MAIQMTKEQYRQKYGISPVRSEESQIDVTPAPVRMTREEYNTKFGIKPFENKGVIRDAVTDIADIGRGLKRVATETFQKGTELGQARQRGEITRTSEVIGRLGAGAIGGINMGEEIIMGVLKTPFHPAQEEAIANFIGEKGAQAIDFTSKEYRKQVREWSQSRDVTMRELATSLSGIEERYKTDPNFKAKADGLGGIGIATAELIGFKGTGKVIKGTVKVGEDYTKPTIKTAKEVIANRLVPARSPESDRVINRDVSRMGTLEDKYVQLRNLNNRLDETEIEASRRRIASTGVLREAVDADGVIRTSGKGGVVDRYRELTIGDVENVVSKNLKLEGRRINAQEIENALILGVNRSGLTGADLNRALGGIKKEIEGLKRRADDLDNVPLAHLHEAKISETNQINFNKKRGASDSATETFRKAKADVYRSLVEQKSGLDIKEINKGLQPFLRDIERLQLYDGRRAQGGRLGRYFSQVTGTIVGGATGSAVGGGAGMAVGTIVGGELADLLTRTGMRKTFRAPDGKKPKRADALEEAKARAEAGEPIRDLSKPDKPVGVPKGTLKTHEMRVVEREIRDNVKQQKEAIKKGDFTLVETLKEIYNKLVERLRSLVREVKDLSEETGSQRGMIRNPVVREAIEKNKKNQPVPRGRNIFNEAKEALAKFPNGDPNARELLSDYVIGRKTEATRTELATAIDMLQSNKRGKRKTSQSTTTKTKQNSTGGNNNIGEQDIPIRRQPRIGLSTQSTGAFGKGADEVFNDFEDLTAKHLKDLTGRKAVSKQFIEDLSNKPELKQPERDLIHAVLDEFEGKVNVQEYANKIKARLLPVESHVGFGRYENITLPDTERGNIAKYGERVYESPIRNSAGDVHHSGGGFDNYFAHTRIEDMADGSTRRVIEVQSDLFQKGRLEPSVEASYRERYGDLTDVGVAAQNADLAQLQPYRNTWWERIVREELRQASIDGKTKLQFPTGETAMKIEGLGDNTQWYSFDKKLSLEDLKVGESVQQGLGNDDWIITEVLDDGKFKATPRSAFDDVGLEEQLGVSSPDDAIEIFKSEIGKGGVEGTSLSGSDVDFLQETFDISGKVDTNNPIYKFYEKDMQKYLKKNYGAKKITDENGVEWVELNVPKDAKKLPIEAFGVALAVGVGVTAQE